MPDLERAAHPGRVADLAVGRAEDGTRRLLQDQRDAPGREQGVERTPIQPLDHRAFDQDADRAGQKE
jgi:hypothetical protein